MILLLCVLQPTNPAECSNLSIKQARLRRFGNAVVLCNCLPESLSLEGSDLKLERRWLTGAIRACEGSCAPRRTFKNSTFSNQHNSCILSFRGNKLTTMDLSQVRQLRESVLVAKGNVNEAMVHESGQRVRDGDLLSTTLSTCGDEDTAHLSCKSTLAPQRACSIPECLYERVSG